jgi:hypothetical protein
MAHNLPKTPPPPPPPFKAWHYVTGQDALRSRADYEPYFPSERALTIATTQWLNCSPGYSWLPWQSYGSLKKLQPTGAEKYIFTHSIIVTMTMGNNYYYSHSMMQVSLHHLISVQLGSKGVWGLKVWLCTLPLLYRGVDLPGFTLGFAFIGTMCQGQTSVGLTQDVLGTVDTVGSIAAHELGHIFSMEHDEGRYGMWAWRVWNLNVVRVWSVSMWVHVHMEVSMKCMEYGTWTWRCMSREYGISLRWAWSEHGEWDVRVPL